MLHFLNDPNLGDISPVFSTTRSASRIPKSIGDHLQHNHLHSPSIFHINIFIQWWWIVLKYPNHILGFVGGWAVPQKIVMTICSGPSHQTKKTYPLKLRWVLSKSQWQNYYIPLDTSMMLSIKRLVFLALFLFIVLSTSIVLTAKTLHFHHVIL